MLVLLVIFMITAPILQSGIEVDVPKTKTVKEIAESRVVVSIDRAQRIYIGDSPVNVKLTPAPIVYRPVAPSKPTDQPGPPSGYKSDIPY